MAPPEFFVNQEVAPEILRSKTDQHRFAPLYNPRITPPCDIPPAIELVLLMKDLRLERHPYPSLHPAVGVSVQTDSILVAVKYIVYCKESLPDNPLVSCQYF